MMMTKYSLVTAVRNEASFIRQTLESVVSQEIQPETWFIIDDNSTDSTPLIIHKYAEKYPFIKLLQHRTQENRNFASKCLALKEGFSRLDYSELNFIGILDGDIRIPSNYYRTIMEKFDANEHLGIAGGWIYEEHNGKFKPRKNNSFSSVPGAVQFFRKQCFLDIGSGYTPMEYGGVDWVAELRARYNGWQTQTFLDIRIDHLKAPSSSYLYALRRRMIEGVMDYTVGEAWIHELIKCTKRTFEFPWFLGSFLRMSAYTYSLLTRKKILVEKEIVDFLHRERSMIIRGRLKRS